jgi:hypothetical protein
MQENKQESTPSYSDEHAARIASEKFVTLDETVGSKELYMTALDIFATRTDGQVTENEAEFVARCINGALINNADPTGPVEIIASKLNESLANALRKYLAQEIEAASLKTPKSLEVVRVERYLSEVDEAIARGEGGRGNRTFEEDISMQGEFSPEEKDFLINAMPLIRQTYGNRMPAHVPKTPPPPKQTHSDLEEPAQMFI